MSKLTQPYKLSSVLFYSDINYPEMAIHLGDVWEPFIDRKGKVKFRRKDSLHRRKPVYVWASSRYLCLKRDDGEEVQVTRAGSEKGESCPACGWALEGEVLKWRKRKSGYIKLVMNVRCAKCGKVYESIQYVYDYEKEKL